jgi:carbohydrate-selective porin OprB
MSGRRPGGGPSPDRSARGREKNSTPGLTTGRPGSNGTFASRPDDMCGIGYYFSSISGRAVVQETPQGPLRLERGYSIEMYYNYAITPRARFTPDLQVVQGNIRGADPALIFGLRLQVVY